jgi:adenine deaminase
LLHSRQADLVDHYPTAVRRFAEKPQLDVQSPAIVLGTTPNGLPPGIALHAEFRALAEAGLQSERILRAAGIYAASALGLGLRIGRIAPGASADLVIVDGDPLASIDNALKIVGVVRNGRFYSAIGLIERAEQAKSVD